MQESFIGIGTHWLWASLLTAHAIVASPSAEVGPPIGVTASQPQGKDDIRVTVSEGGDLVVRRRDASRSVVVSHKMIRLDSFSVRGNTVAVLGSIRSTVQMCVIISLDDYTQKDVLLGNAISISPDGRFVVGTHVVPRFIADDAQASSIYLAYDRDLAPTKNRIGSTSKVLDDECWGAIVFPADLENSAACNTPPGAVVHGLRGPFFWKSNEEVVFVDATDSSTELVAVSLTAGTSMPTRRAGRIDVDRLFGGAATEQEAKRRAKSVYARKISVNRDGDVVIDFEPVEGMTQRTLVVTVDPKDSKGSSNQTDASKK